MNKILFLCSLILPFYLYGFEVKKEISNQFSASEFTSINVNNEYGNITFLPTKNDSINVKVSITADILEFGDTSNIFANISNSMQAVGNKLKIKTSYKEALNNLSMVHVHYYISIPDTINIDISNRYGNILLFNVYGTKNIVLEYGKIYCANLKGPDLPASKYSLIFSELRADTVSNSVFFSNSSQLNIGTVQKAQIQSVFSYIHILHSEDLTCTTETDKYEIDKVDYLIINGENTTCLIKQLNKFLELELSKGDLIIGNVSPQFTDINLNVNNVNSAISINPDASFYMNAVIEYGELKYPKRMEASKITDVETITYNGQLGDAEKTGSQIGIIGVSSSISLKAN